MKCLLLSVVLLLGTLAIVVPANAGDRGYRGDNGYKSPRGGPKVKGYAQRRGGYSYDYLDTINTYSNVDEFRDPDVDRQSIMGPFDHGFFFDSVTGLAGGSAPYMN